MDCGKSQKCETLEQGIPEQNPVLKVNYFKMIKPYAKQSWKGLTRVS